MKKTTDTANTLRTKQAIATQMSSLLERRRFKSITVNDICEQAKIGRSTFYLHFDDKYDLFRYCMTLELSRWVQVRTDTDDIGDFLEFALNAILEKRQFYYNALVAEPNQELSEIFQQLCSEFFTDGIKNMQLKLPANQETASVMTAFYAGGLVCSTVEWMRSGFRLSVEDMAACQKQLLAPLFQ
jgi:AcrR family transcriptional regulator